MFICINILFYMDVIFMSCEYIVKNNTSTLNVNNKVKFVQQNIYIPVKHQ